MSSRWYVVRAGEPHGPLSGGQLKRLAEAGQLKPADLVCKEGGDKWVPARSVKGLFPLPPHVPEVASPDTPAVPETEAKPEVHPDNSWMGWLKRTARNVQSRLEEAAGGAGTPQWTRHRLTILAGCVLVALLLGGVGLAIILGTGGLGRSAVKVRSWGPAPDPICQVLFALNGDRVVTTDAMNVHIWDTATGRKLHSFRPGTFVLGTVAVSPDGRRVACGSDEGASLWDVETGRKVHAFGGRGTLQVSFDQDGSHLFTFSTNARTENANTPNYNIIYSGATVRVYDLKGDLKGFREERSFQAGGGAGSWAATLAQGAGVAIIHFIDVSKHMQPGHFECRLEGEPIRVIDLATGRELRTLQGFKYEDSPIALSRDGRRALSGLKDGGGVLWDVAGGREIRRFSGHGEPVSGLAFSPDGCRALTGAGTTARLWDVEGGTEVCRLTGHADRVRCLAFSADGRRALSGSQDGMIHLWKLPE
jgi:hypothetical protein